jgi:hypothetical protein
MGTLDDKNNLTGGLRISRNDPPVHRLQRLSMARRATFQGLNQAKRRSATCAEPADRPCHAQHASAGFWRGVNVNHNAVSSETFWTSFWRRGQSLKFRRKLMANHPKHHTAQRRGRKWLEQARAWVLSARR